MPHPERWLEELKGVCLGFHGVRLYIHSVSYSSFVLSYAEGTEQRLRCVLTLSSSVQEGVGEYSNEAHNFQYLSWYIDQM